jgi:cation diffusion facilitator family transporter
LASEKSSLEKGENAAKLSSFAVFLIGLTKGVVGFFSGSIALVAQAVDSLTDIFASVTVYIGLKVARRKPTERFPYGYYRAETFASLIVAAFIIASGAAILVESIIRFLQPETVSFPQVALLVAAVSIPFLYFLANYNKKIGEEINSQAIIGQAKNFTLDVFSSVLVFVGVLFSYLGAPWIEAVVSVLISIFVLKAGAEVGRDAVLTLMDAVVIPEHIEKIKKAAEEIQGVVDVHDIKIRKSGPFCFGEMHMDVEEDLSVEKAHAITEEVERNVKQQCKQLETLTIHMEPAKRRKFRIAIPIQENKGLESTPKAHFGSASQFIFVDVDQEHITNWLVKPNPGANLSKKRGITTANFLITEKATTLLTRELGEGPFHVLRDSFIEIYKFEKESNVKKTVEVFLHGKLEKIVSPKKKS